MVNWPNTVCSKSRCVGDILDWEPPALLLMLGLRECLRFVFAITACPGLRVRFCAVCDRASAVGKSEISDSSSCQIVVALGGGWLKHILGRI